MSDTNPDGTTPVPPQPASPPAQPDPPAYGAPSAYPPPTPGTTPYGGPPAATPPYPTAPLYGSEPSPYGAAPSAYGSEPSAYGAAPAYGTAPAYGGYTPAKTNTLAIVSLISSLVGLLIIPLIGSIAGVITGHMSLGQIKQTGEQGRGLALAGTIVGYVGLAFALFGLIFFFAFLPLLIASVSTSV